MPSQSNSFSYQTSSSSSSSISKPMMGKLNKAYADALSRSDQTYNSMLSGYAQTTQQYRNDMAAAQAQYASLQNQVMNEIRQVGDWERQDLQDQYAAASGKAAQDLISRGLGNSTVQDSIQRGLLYDKAKSDVALTGNIANLRGQYLTATGLPAANAAVHGADVIAQLMGQGYGNLTQKAGQQAGLANSYMNQLRVQSSRSLSNSMGYSTNQARTWDTAQLGGGGGGSRGGGGGGGGYQTPYYAPQSPGGGYAGGYPNPTYGSGAGGAYGTGGTGSGGMYGWTGESTGVYPASQGIPTSTIGGAPSWYDPSGGFSGGAQAGGGGSSTWGDPSAYDLEMYGEEGYG